MLNGEEEDEELEYEYLDQNINNLEEATYEIFFTKDQYQNSKYFDDFYTASAEVYQTDPNKSYNLRYGAKQIAQSPKKKVVAPAK